MSLTGLSCMFYKGQRGPVQRQEVSYPYISLCFCHQLDSPSLPFSVTFYLPPIFFCPLHLPARPVFSSLSPDFTRPSLALWDYIHTESDKFETAVVWKHCVFMSISWRKKHKKKKKIALLSPLVFLMSTSGKQWDGLVTLQHTKPPLSLRCEKPAQCEQRDKMERKRWVLSSVGVHHVYRGRVMKATCQQFNSFSPPLEDRRPSTQM